MGTKKNKSNYLVQGTILAAASIFARIIGMIYRIPLTRILGDEGNAYYGSANSIYSILLMISTFSLPLAVSKLVSEQLHKGQMKNAQKIFHCSMKFAVLCGGVISLLTFLLADVICGTIMRVDNAAYALRVISPAIFIFAIAGVYRGYFQGHETMIPTATSQVIEQIVNAFVSVIAAGLLFQYGLSLKDADASAAPAWGAAGGTVGTVVSVSVALIFLMIVYGSFQKGFKKQIAKDSTKKLDSDQAIYKAILITILPIVFSTLIYNLSPTLDQAIFNTILSGQGYTKEQYNTIYGIYLGKFYVLMNVPLALASCLAPSVVPALTAAMVDGNYKDAKIKVRNTMRYTMIITIPCAVGMAVLASPIMQLIFGDSHKLPAGIMQAGALMIVLFAISTLTTSILQGMGKMNIPLKNSAVALIIHVAVLILFLKQFRLNIYGVVYANTIFALVICVLNSMALKRYLHYRQEIRKTFLIPLISSGFMAIAAFVVYWIFDTLLNYIFIEAASNAIAAILGILAGATVYGFFLIKLKGVREHEILNLPKGVLMVSILKKIRFL